MDRDPVVAGRFYPDHVETLHAMIDGYLSDSISAEEGLTRLCMVPHAGYVFSGAVCGKTLASANLAPTVLLLGPNHTGRGASLSLWDSGLWHMPGGAARIDEELVACLADPGAGLVPDTQAHMQEHSLEVVIPFLQRLNPDVSIVPVCVSEPSLSVLEQSGRAIGRSIAKCGRPVSIVVSSDMSHYISHEQAKQADSLAIEAVLNLDPAGLFSVVRENRISMCGVLPMTLGLFAALEMGATSARLVDYATSGEVSGDFEQVVGYAGLLVS